MSRTLRAAAAALATALALVLAGCSTAPGESRPAAPTRSPDVALSAPGPIDQKEPGAVILLPGYANFSETMDPLSEALEATGRTTYIVAGTDDGTGDLRDQAELVRDTAAQALAAGAPSVDLVAFSAGGLAARWFVQELGGEAVTRRVLTLSSPHHGTALVENLECPIGCMQLSPDSDLIAALNSDDETPQGPAWVATWIDGDTAVVPATSGRLRGATNFVLQSICPRLDLTHSEIPADPTVAAIVLTELSADPVGRPGPGVCTTPS